MHIKGEALLYSFQIVDWQFGMKSVVKDTWCPCQLLLLLLGKLHNLLSCRPQFGLTWHLQTWLLQLVQLEDIFCLFVHSASTIIKISPQVSWVSYVNPFRPFSSVLEYFSSIQLYQLYESSSSSSFSLFSSVFGNLPIKFNSYLGFLSFLIASFQVRLGLPLGFHSGCLKFVLLNDSCVAWICYFLW